MDEVIHQTLKTLSSTVVVHIYSTPHFTIELFLACVVCVVHCLLIFQINELVKKTQANAEANLLEKSSIKAMQVASYHSFANIVNDLGRQEDSIACYASRSFRRPKPPKLFSNTAFSFRNPYPPEVESMECTYGSKHHYDKIELLLSISPSQYIKNDKERICKENALHTCFRSLSSVIEQSLQDDPRLLDQMSLDNIKNILNLSNNDTNFNMSNLSNFSRLSDKSLHHLNDNRKSLLRKYLTKTDSYELFKNERGDFTKESELKSEDYNNVKDNENSKEETNDSDICNENLALISTFGDKFVHCTPIAAQ